MCDCRDIIYELQDNFDDLFSEYRKKFKENRELKELLKECLEVLKLVAGETIDFPYTVDTCIEKINKTLGEVK